MQIKDYLYSKKLQLLLLNKKPEGMKDDEWNLLNRKMFGVSRLIPLKKAGHNMAAEKTTTGLMKVLSDMNGKPCVCNKVHLMKKLFNLNMTEGATVVEHLNKFNTIINQLIFIEIKSDDEVCAIILLALLPNS